MAKIATPLMVAAFLAKRGGALRLSVVVPAGAFIALPVVLIGYQPDLGTAVIIAVAGAGLLFIAGVSWRLLGAFAAAGLASLPFAWYWLKDYQRERVISFLDPDRNPLGAGYQVFQSKIAIGSGGSTERDGSTGRSRSSTSSRNAPRTSCSRCWPRSSGCSGSS